MKRSYKGRTYERSDNIFDETIVTINPPRKSNKFDSPSLYYDGVYYFLEDLMPSDRAEGKQYSIQGVYYRGKWRQDTFYITEELKDLLIKHQ